MEMKKLVYNTFLYGVGDVIVLAVSGFLLMPLYTRTLSSSDYGIFVVTRTNTEIFTYLLQFGLVSALSRLYFDYKKQGNHFSYVSSILTFFLLYSFFFGMFIYFWGRDFWNFLSPETPSAPFLWFALTLAFLNFFSALSNAWLRLEEKARVFVFLQVFSAVILLILVALNLLFFKTGLHGLMHALIISSFISALSLPYLLGNNLAWKIDWGHVYHTFSFAFPVFIGYCAYFFLNRGNTIILQRHVPLEQMAIFGLGQQLALIVSIAANAFGKAIQPIIFMAKKEDAKNLIAKSGELYLFLMTGFAIILSLFSSDLLSIAAPPKYMAAYSLFLIFIFSNFVLSATFISNSTLLYYKFPVASVSISVFGGGLTLIFSLILIPKYKLYGAAIANLIAYAGVLVAGFSINKFYFGFSGLSSLLYLLPIAGLFSFLALAVNHCIINPIFAFFVKLVFALFACYVSYQKLSRKDR